VPFAGNSAGNEDGMGTISVEMALFVFGAGATRGCSFVDAEAFSCIPPLDRDFFTQLQRVANPKHQELVKQVTDDVVQLFGLNFDVTMETVFTTLEHTIRMLATTGEHKDFKVSELREKRDRLEQAIAAVLEESLTMNVGGTSSLKPKDCNHHAKFVQQVLRPQDSMISFNYDCVLDFSLKAYGDGKWNARYGYGFNLGKSRKQLDGHEFWQPKVPASITEGVKLFKLHGSLHFVIQEVGSSSHVHLKERPYTKQAGKRLFFTIIPPEWHKAYDEGAFATLWAKASAAIYQADHIVLIGYSLPGTDLHSTALFRTSTKKEKLKSLVVVNPNAEARRRTRSVLQRGMTRQTRVLTFESLPQFLAADRNVWAM
jgi:hypothetical protein